MLTLSKKFTELKNYMRVGCSKRNHAELQYPIRYKIFAVLLLRAEDRIGFGLSGLIQKSLWERGYK